MKLPPLEVIVFGRRRGRSLEVSFLSQFDSETNLNFEVAYFVVMENSSDEYREAKSDFRFETRYFRLAGQGWHYC